MLLFLDNTSSNLPICSKHHSTGSSISLLTATLNDRTNVIYKRFEKWLL